MFSVAFGCFRFYDELCRSDVKDVELRVGKTILAPQFKCWLRNSLAQKCCLQSAELNAVPLWPIFEREGGKSPIYWLRLTFSGTTEGCLSNRL